MGETEPAIRERGPGNPYPRELKSRARELWASGDYGTDDEIAKAIGLPSARAGKTIHEWRTRAEPDGVDWHEFRAQSVTEGLTRATDRLANRFAEDRMRTAGQLHGLATNLLGWGIAILNQDVFGPLSQDPPQRPKIPIDNTLDLERLLKCVKTVREMEDDLAVPRTRRLIEPEQVAALAEQMEASLLTKADGHTVGIAMLAWTDALLASLPPGGGNGDIIATHEAEEDDSE